MINFNGDIVVDENIISIHNRGYNYGDALFETVRTLNGKILFWEDHYFRLMASMRILRMEIPMIFTMEFLEMELVKTIEANALISASVRLKLMVHRNNGGLYLPDSNAIGYLITASRIDDNTYKIHDQKYEVDLFKDFYLAPNLLSTLKTNSKAINVLGSIYANENGLDNCLLLNTNKNVVEALNGNIFVIKGKTIKTPPLADGCIKGILRKQIIEILKDVPDYKFEEISVSPFELQKADEIFITNVIGGIQSVSKYRKKEFSNELAKLLTQKLNVKIRLS